MNKAIKKFILFSMAAIFVLLFALLCVINVINFQMASEDADRITQMIADHGGVMRAEAPEREKDGFDPGRQRFGPMGPESPDVISSIQYFTLKIRNDGGEELVSFKMSAVSEKEAIEWAKSLSKETTGWTNGTYRFRVYEIAKERYITVTDQARELLPSYRILCISLIGGIVCLAVSFAVISFVGRKLFAPIEEADRRQRKFIASAESEFKLPLTVINANADIIERESGVSERTAAIRRQVRKMSDLVRTLGDFAVVEEDDMQKTDCDLSMLLQRAVDSKKDEFAERGISVDCVVEDCVTLKADRDVMDSLARELVKNALKFSLTRATFSLRRENERIVLTATNDAALSGEGAEQIFDRFVRLENAGDKEGAGLGLSFVKDAVKAHDGRVNAFAADGVFTIRIDL